jgi:hypothetical protein
MNVDAGAPFVNYFHWPPPPQTRCGRPGKSSIESKGFLFVLAPRCGDIMLFL